jgi:hypothetical protein
MMDSISYKKNKKAKNKELILSGIAIAMSLFMIKYSDQNNMILFIAMFLGLPGFALYVIYNSLLDNATVTVNQFGISSNTNLMGLVKWEYIVDFEIEKAVNSKVLVVNINDIESFLSEKNIISTQLMKSNIKRLGSPVIIPESEFNYSLDVVKREIEDYKNSI